MVDRNNPQKVSHSEYLYHLQSAMKRKKENSNCANKFTDEM